MARQGVKGILELRQNVVCVTLHCRVYAQFYFLTFIDSYILDVAHRSTTLPKPN